MQFLRKGGRVKKNKNNNTTNHNVNKNNITIHNNISSPEKQEKERLDKGARIYNGLRMNGNTGPIPKLERDKEHEPLKDRPINIIQPNIGGGSISDLIHEPIKQNEEEEPEQQQEQPEQQQSEDSKTDDELRKDKVYTYFNGLANREDFFKITKKGVISANLNNMCLHFNFERPIISRRQIYIRLEQCIDGHLEEY